jgi:Holliday junction resolvase
MGQFSKDKGKRGERELANELERVLGINARRGVQFQGSPDSPDVITSIPNIHIECKRTERFRLYEALEQATNDAGKNKVPIVCHRQNNKPWVVIVKLDDVPNLYSLLTTHNKNERTNFTNDNSNQHHLRCRNADTSSDGHQNVSGVHRIDAGRNRVSAD